MFIAEGSPRRHDMGPHHRLGPVTVASLDCIDDFQVVMGAAIEVVAVVIAKRLQDQRCARNRPQRGLQASAACHLLQAVMKLAVEIGNPFEIARRAVSGLLALCFRQHA